MLISAVLFSISAVGCAVCGNFDALVAYRIVGGVGIGVVSIVSPIYISEVSPARIRGTLVSLYQLAVTVGFLLAYMANWLIDINGDLAVTGDFWTSMWNNVKSKFSTNNFKKIRIPQFSETRFGSFVGLFLVYKQ